MRNITYYDAAEGGGVQSVDGYGSYVMANDFDDLESEFNAAQSELAALREELALTNERWSKCLEGAEKKCERQIRRNARLVGQRNTMQLKRDEARKRLVVAVRLLTALYDDTPIVWPDIADFLAMNKPTESGASE